MMTAVAADHDVERLIHLFDNLFRRSHNTVLVRGTGEPLYQPADETHDHHQIIFAHGYFASALHEIAHWCIAGRRRRKLPDYGYWYKPDGRTPEEQKTFESVEIKPQALEWIFSVAAGRPFVFSADNLDGGTGSSQAFKQAVHARVLRFLSEGLPARAARFTRALCHQHGTHWPINSDCFPKPREVES